MASHQLFLVFLVTLASVRAISSLEFSVINNAGNTAGGFRFDLEIGASYAEQTLRTATEFTWKIFQQDTDADRKSVNKITLFIDAEYDGVAYASGDDIFIAANYIARYSGDVRSEVVGILYHEVTHVWQWRGNSKAPAPRWVIEGVADFVRLRSGFVSGEWVAAGEGERWDEGRGVEAKFLEYVEGLGSGFVAELNRKMRDGYRDEYFEELMRRRWTSFGPDTRERRNNYLKI